VASWVVSYLAIVVSHGDDLVLLIKDDCPDRNIRARLSGFGERNLHQRFEIHGHLLWGERLG
jgi:hypothetical protein